MLKFNEDFIKNYDEDCGKGYFLKVDVEFPIFNVIDHPYQKEWKLIDAISLYAICNIKKTVLFT